MNVQEKELLLKAADLLTKAASQLEYGRNLEKEAAATADEVISRGMATTDQREFYKDYLAQHPDKIASIKNAFSNLPLPANTGLGEAANIGTNEKGLDAFDLALLGQ